jgi:S1-C subfamily serine protease
MLAAFADGTVSFDDIDEAVLERYVQAVGMDPLVKDLIHTAEAGSRESGEQSSLRMAFVRRAPRLPGIRQLGWMAAAATLAVALVGGYLVNRQPVKNQTARQSAEAPVVNTALILGWPPKDTFNPATRKIWGLQPAQLAARLPDFNKSVGTLGAGGEDRFARWRQATVIVRSPFGWGSGAFIAPDTWLLTNYHVVAGAAQEASLTGKPTSLDIITPTIVDGKLRPQPALKATLYRADPVHDLALLKLDRLPTKAKAMPFFHFAQRVLKGEDCYVIGSQNSGLPAWKIRSGNVVREFNYPEDLSQGAASSGTGVERDRATMILTDTRTWRGDSGGPLLNSNGELIGLTFAPPGNRAAGSIGWHIALPPLHSFTADLPSRPEGTPFDPWTAGLPGASMLEPELMDGDGNGRIDSLVYRYAGPSQDAPSSLDRLLGVTAFVDLEERGISSNDPLDKVPVGLWGMEKRGRFRFDLLLTARADGIVVAGYTNKQGIVDDLRIGQAGQDATAIVWRRAENGKWSVNRPVTPLPLIDSARIGSRSFDRLRVIGRSVGLTSARIAAF